jgi:hypothetical protein
MKNKNKLQFYKQIDINIDGKCLDEVIDILIGVRDKINTENVSSRKPTFEADAGYNNVELFVVYYVDETDEEYEKRIAEEKVIVASEKAERKRLKKEWELKTYEALHKKYGKKSK